MILYAQNIMQYVFWLPVLYAHLYGVICGFGHSLGTHTTATRPIASYTGRRKIQKLVLNYFKVLLM